MTYRTTRQADQEIIDLYLRGVENFGVTQAERYVDELFEVCELLAENPHLARERREIDPPTRLHPYHAHMIAYIIQEDGILIVRVLHGRQNWQSLLS